MRGISIGRAFWYNFDMNIKRRLFISNILMVVIPFVLSLAIFWCGMYVMGSVTGLRERYKDKPRGYVAAVGEARSLAARWSEEAAGHAPEEGGVALAGGDLQFARSRVRVVRPSAGADG